MSAEKKPYPAGLCITGDAAGAIRPIAEAEALCFSEPWSEKALADFLSFAYNGVLVAHLDGVFSGYVTYTALPPELQIANIAVLSAYRGRGIASALLAALREKAIRLACTEITLEVRASNAPAIALYRAAGFEQVGTRRAYYRKPTEDALLWTLSL